MSFVEINWNPSRRQLAQFGMIAVVALPLIGWLWGATTGAIVILAATGSTLAFLGFCFPSVAKPIFVAACLLAIPIGLVIGEICMLAVFFLVILPTGLLRRCLKRDPLQLKIDRNAKSYWHSTGPAKPPASYYRQS